MVGTILLWTEVMSILLFQIWGGSGSAWLSPALFPSGRFGAHYRYGRGTV